MHKSLLAYSCHIYNNITSQYLSNFLYLPLLPPIFSEEDVDWKLFHIWLEERGRELVEIPADGLCFLRALQHCLAVQHNEKYSLQEIKIKILEEITNKSKQYMAFHTAKNPQEMLQQMREYLHQKIFAQDIVDVIIGLCCNIFTVTLWIFQESAAGRLESISYSTDKQEQRRRHVHVALYHDRGDVDGFGSHYNAVVSKKKNKGQLYMDLSSGPPSQGKYLLLSHRPLINLMTSIQLLRNLKCCLTSTVNQMHQCLIYLPQTSVSCSLWKYLMGYNNNNNNNNLFLSRQQS